MPLKVFLVDFLFLTSFSLFMLLIHEKQFSKGSTKKRKNFFFTLMIALAMQVNAIMTMFRHICRESELKHN